MGLYVSFTPTDLGLPTTLTQIVADKEVTVDIDYSSACDAFVDTFMSVATELVPVDTGYLRSTIQANTNGFLCEASADAEYAQYVEYGTWRMVAQPYFEPAVREGIASFGAEAQMAIDEAQQILEEMCEAVIESVMAELGSEGGFLEELFDTLFGGLMLWLLFPFFLLLYGILDTVFNAGQGGNKTADFDLPSMGVNVIIT